MNVYENELRRIVVNPSDILPSSKIRKLDGINKMLAHRPWTVKSHHIKVSEIIVSFLYNISPLLDIKADLFCRLFSIYVS